MKSRLILSLVLTSWLVGCSQETMTPLSPPQQGPGKGDEKSQTEDPAQTETGDSTKREAEQLMRELQQTRAELQQKLEDSARRELDSFGETNPNTVVPQRVGPWPPQKDQLHEKCALENARIVSSEITVDAQGRTAKVRIKISSGVDSCDLLVKETLEETRWEPCDPETSDLTCVFDYTLSFSVHYD